MWSRVPNCVTVLCVLFLNCVAFSATEECFLVGQTRMVQIPGPIGNLYPVSGGKVFLVEKLDHTIDIVKGFTNSSYRTVTTGEMKTLTKLDAGDGLTEIQTSASGRYSLFKSGARTFIIDAQDLKIIDVPFVYEGGGLFTPDDSSVLFESGGRITQFSLKGHGNNTFAVEQPKTFFYTDKTSERFFEVSFDKFPAKIKSIVIHDMRSNAKVTIAGDEVSNFSALRKNYSVMIQGHQYTLVSPQFSKSGLNHIEIQGDSGPYNQGIASDAVKLEFFDGDRKVSLNVPFADTFQGKTYTEDYIVSSKFFEDKTLSVIFEKQKYGCAPIQKGQDLAKNLGEIFTKRNGQFNLKTDLATIIASVRDPIVMNNNGELLSTALATVLEYSSTLYATLVNDYPQIKKLPAPKAEYLAQKNTPTMSDRAFAMRSSLYF